MKKEDLVQKSLEILDALYRNNPEPLKEASSSNLFLLGPTPSLIFHGKAAVLESLAHEPLNLRYRLGNMTAGEIVNSRDCAEVYARYSVETVTSDNKITTDWRRAQLTWVKIPGADKKKHWAITMLHLSFEAPEAVTYEAPAMKNDDEKIVFSGTDGVIRYLSLSSITWIESKLYNSIVTSSEGTFIARESVNELATRYPNLLYRPHISFLINPHAAQSICRFKLTMKDGKTIPLPEKKYTRVKKYLSAYFKQADNEKE